MVGRIEELGHVIVWLTLSIGLIYKGIKLSMDAYTALGLLVLFGGLLVMTFLVGPPE